MFCTWRPHTYLTTTSDPPILLMDPLLLPTTSPIIAHLDVLYYRKICVFENQMKKAVSFPHKKSISSYSSLEIFINRAVNRRRKISVSVNVIVFMMIITIIISMISQLVSWFCVFLLLGSLWLPSDYLIGLVLPDLPIKLHLIVVIC